MYTEMIISECRKIYAEAFSADKNECDAVFSCLENDLRCLTVDGRVASMLFLVDATYHDSEVLKPFKYIFAAATDIQSRSKGYMSTLITQVIDEARSNGYAGVYLYPSNESLRNYYKKIGFFDCFGFTETKVTDLSVGKSATIIEFKSHRCGSCISCNDLFLNLAKKLCNGFFVASDNSSSFVLDSDGGVIIDTAFSKPTVMSELVECTARIRGNKNKGMAVLFDNNIDTSAYLCTVLD